MRVVDKLLFEKGMKEDCAISQKRAAEEIGITQTSFHQIMTGQIPGTRGSTIEKKKRIAKYFGISFESLDGMLKEEAADAKTSE